MNFMLNVTYLEKLVLLSKSTQSMRLATLLKSIYGESQIIRLRGWVTDVKIEGSRSQVIRLRKGESEIIRLRGGQR